MTDKERWEERKELSRVVVQKDITIRSVNKEKEEIISKVVGLTQVGAILEDSLAKDWIRLEELGGYVSTVDQAKDRSGECDDL